jgi:hypothetical protein
LLDTVRGNRFKFAQTYSHHDSRKSRKRIVSTRNGLSDEVISARTVCSFMIKLDVHWFLYETTSEWKARCQELKTEYDLM